MCFCIYDLAEEMKKFGTIPVEDKEQVRNSELVYDPDFPWSDDPEEPTGAVFASVKGIWSNPIACDAIDLESIFKVSDFDFTERGKYLLQRACRQKLNWTARMEF